jgi:hypothetical protein
LITVIQTRNKATPMSTAYLIQKATGVLLPAIEIPRDVNALRARCPNSKRRSTGHERAAHRGFRQVWHQKCGLSVMWLTALEPRSARKRIHR